MAVDLHTAGDSSLPYPFPPPSHDLNHSNNYSNDGSALNLQGENNVAELTRQMQMAHSMLQHHHKFDFSRIGSDNLESPWDSISSPQSTLWYQGSPEGSSSSPKEPSAPADIHDSGWESTYEVVGMLEKMKLDERGSSKYHPDYGIPSLELETSPVGVGSYQSLLQEQIRAIQLSRVRQEQILSLKQKLAAYGEHHGRFQKKGKGADGRKARPQRPGPPHQQALFPGASGSRGTSCGTGVFLPRAGSTSAPSESRERPGKGCSTVLIPARVVQALQLHFDQIAATSGPKPGGFPPLHDVLVSNSDGMYSLQKRPSRKQPAHIQNEIILPREWTY